MKKTENISFWLKNIERPKLPSITEDNHSDVTIVGAGITGLTLAYLLSKQNLSVTIVESNQVFGNTSGKTTAKITAQHGLIYNKLIQTVGLEKAQMYFQANEEAIAAIKKIIKQEKINALFTEQDAYTYTTNEKNISHIENEFMAYEKLGIHGRICTKTPLDLPVKSAIKMKQQAQFHPTNYLNSLLKICLDRGVKVFENSPVVNIISENHKKVVAITEQKQHITSNHIVISSLYPMKNLRNFLFLKLQQNRSYVLATKLKLPYPGGMYINIDDPTYSIRAMKDEKLNDICFITGSDEKTGSKQANLDSSVRSLLKFGQSVFLMNKNDLITSWSAQDVMTPDKIPYIGPLTKNQPNILIATGFNKWGMSQSMVAAKELTAQILTGKSKYSELYDPSRSMMKQMKGLTQNFFEISKEMISGKLKTNNQLIDKDKISKLQYGSALTGYVKGRKVGVYKNDQGKVSIVDTTCTHMKCETNWNEHEKSWDCPCHGSRFDFKGNVLEGPATKSLKRISEDELSL